MILKEVFLPKIMPCCHGNRLPHRSEINKATHDVIVVNRLADAGQRNPAKHPYAPPLYKLHRLVAQ